MNYKGVIIEESLEDSSVLNDVQIIDTRVEKVVEEHKTPQLKQWTLHTVEIPEEKASKFADKLSKIIKKAWYADYKNNNYHYIIYRNKIFKVKINKLEEYEEYKVATEYGISLGIPDYQVDFAPDTKVWER